MQLSVVAGLCDHGLDFGQLLHSFLKLYQLSGNGLLAETLVLCLFFVLGVNGGHGILLLFLVGLREHGCNLDVRTSHGDKVQVEIGMAEDLLVRLGSFFPDDQYPAGVDLCLVMLVLVGLNFCVGVERTQGWLLSIQALDCYLERWHHSSECNPGATWDILLHS